jgi:hypothetical protein
MTTQPMHPRARAAAMSHSPKQAARETGLTQREVRDIRELQHQRQERKRFFDPLLIKAATRAHRTATAKAAAEAQRTEREARQAREIAAIEARRLREEGIRQTMALIPGAARTCGLTVRTSEDQDGDVSSYYLAGKDTQRTIRVSDHEIPATMKRESEAEFRGYGFYTGYRGPQVIIREPRSETWLRRAILLAANGRSTPGA